MYIAKMTFQLCDHNDEEKVEDLLYYLFGALRMNGQVLGREFVVAQQGMHYQTLLNLPEQDSLSINFANKYVKAGLDAVREAGELAFDIIGQELNQEQACQCGSPQSYILYTNYISLESPLRCGRCFGVIPLYKIPKTYDEEYNDIISWQSNYQSCDTLQMNCRTGERFGYQQMSKHDSSLSLNGIEICKRISRLTGKQTYYFLYRYTSLSRKKGLERKCPSCGGEWLLDESFHDRFDFRCDNCSLLSNISWAVR